MSDDVLIQLKRANKTYEGRFWAIRDTELTVRRGESLAIMGHSGSGKSTMLNILGMLDQLSSGAYIFDGQPVQEFTDRQISEFRNRRIGFIFQSFHLIPQLTVAENVEVPLYYLGVSPKIRRRRSLAVLDLVGLKERTHYRPAKLSGGERQRVAIARSLVNSPDLLLADEPTGNLDSTTGDEIMELIHELHRQGMTLIMVTHDPALGATMQRSVMIRDGRIRTDTADPTGQSLPGGPLPKKKK